MPQTPFEMALAGRVDTMADACTRCGKCVEACPITQPAGMADADPMAVIAGVIDILRTGDGPQASRQWASSCVLSGECIKACDYGVNPRFLLAMARATMTRADNDAIDMRRRGVESFRNLSQGVNVLARMQLDGETLERLAQTGSGGSSAAATRRPTSCSIPAATCSRPRTLRCSPSTSWTRSASPTG
jgi:Fe-S oxidoreductase